MKIPRKSRLFIALAIFALLSLAAMTNGSPGISLTTFAVPVPGTTSVYLEDFTGNTFYDGGASTADGWGQGSITSSRIFSITLLDNYTTNFPVMGVDVQGRKVYVATQGSSALYPSNKILDLTNPDNLRLLSERNSLTDLICGRISGDIFYAGRTTGGIARYNVSDPFGYAVAPVYLGTVSLDGATTDIEVQGHFVYATAVGSAASDAFRIIDFEDPVAPVVLPTIWSSVTTQGLAVEGQIAYLAESQWGLYLCNVSNPYFVTEPDNVDTPGNATDVLVDGSIAYVADGPSGVQVVDVTNPTDISIIGSVDTPGNARRLALHGNTLFVADEDGGVQIFDVTSPAHPTYITEISIPMAYDIDLYEGVLVVGTNNAVLTYRVGDLIPNLVHIASLGGGYDFNDIRIQGDVAFVAGGIDGLLSIDISDPASPVLLDSHVYAPNRFYRRLDIQGHLAFVCDYPFGGIRVYDISDPTDLKYLSTWSLSYPLDVAVAGEVVFVADGTYGAYLGNASDPFSNPTLISFYDLGVDPNVTSVWVQGHHLYAVSNTTSSVSNVAVFDLTDLQNIQPTDISSMAQVHTGIFVDGDVAYISDIGYSVIWNMTDPWNIFFSDTTSASSGSILGTWGFGPYMFTANNTAGIAIFNATSITAMTLDRSASAGSNATQLVTHGDYVYVASRGTLEILRFFESIAGAYNTGPSIAQSLAVDSTTETIVEATLTVNAMLPFGTQIGWELSANGGADWDAVTPGVLHAFTHQGSDLRFRAVLDTNRRDVSAHLFNITIAYTHTQPPTAPVLDDPGVTLPAGDIVITWAASTDPDGTVASYELQSSNTVGFSTILATYPTTMTTHTVSAPTSGDFFFRVRAIDDDGARGPWSNVEDITITGGTPPPPPIPGFPIEAIALGAIFALTFGVLYRRRKR
ncbi:MAG: Loki-CTERM sorting domain-containing protein [Candidatus Hermodarchaeia archaeon]